MGPDDIADSPFFRSEQVQAELLRLDKMVNSIMDLMRKFPEFDTTGKRLFIDQMESVCESIRIFNKRVELAQDPLGNQILRTMNIQLLEANTSLNMQYESMTQFAAFLRQAVDEEERIQDPVLRMRFQEELRERMFPKSFRPEALNSKLYEDPDVLEGMQHPQAMKALEEVMGDPSKLNSYIDRPKLYKFLATVIKQD